MRKYTYENNELILYDSYGVLYKDGKLLFRGDGYISLKMFIENTGNAPSVIAKFKKQLDTREECRWKKQDEQKILDKKMKNLSKPIEEEETPKQVKRRGR